MSALLVCLTEEKNGFEKELLLLDKRFILLNETTTCHLKQDCTKYTSSYNSANTSSTRVFSTPKETQINVPQLRF